MIDKLIDTLLSSGAHKALKILSEKKVIRATRVLYGGKLPGKDRLALSDLIQRDQRANTEIAITIGRPNYRERQFIKLAKKAGESFPIKKVQLKFPRK